MGKSPARETLSAIPGRGRQSWTSSSRRTSHPAGSARPSPLWPHPSSSSKRRMDRSGQFRITDLLNSITVKNKYPLPLVDDLVQRLKGARYFTKLDVRWGYNNIRIKEGDEWKAAFRTNRGLFEPLVMFFGLTNSPATFQNDDERHLRDLIGEGVVCVYMDDILVFAETREELSRVTRIVLERLRKHKLYPQGGEVRVRAGTDRVPRTDHIAQQGRDGSGQGSSGSGVATTPGEEGGSILPRICEPLYRRFIEGFSQVARPLFDLTKKDALFRWSPECDVAFEELKKRIVSAPVLVLPNRPSTIPDQIR